MTRSLVSLDANVLMNPCGSGAQGGNGQLEWGAGVVMACAEPHHRQKNIHIPFAHPAQKDMCLSKNSHGFTAT